jgi:glycosyltransferase involved in cell wall biosynthesis
VLASHRNTLSALGERGPLISVVIPARNAAATIARTLDALADQDLDDNYEVIVVDNGSDDATAAIAERARGPVTVIREARQRPGAGRNRGVGVATAAAIAFTDADCVPDRGWLRAGLEALRDADLVQGAVVADPTTPRHPFDRTVELGGPTALFETANLFVTRAAFNRAGGFSDWAAAAIDEPFGEDAVFGWDARRGGASFAFEPGARVAHAVFHRGPAAYVAERRRLAYFPALVARVPELRAEMLVARTFLTRRSARFDFALGGVALASFRRSPIPLVVALPYGTWLVRRAWPHRRNAARVATTELAADAVGLAALVAGSIRNRTLVI